MTIVIPTKNSAGHIEIILEFYRDIGVRPVLFVDDASEDNTYDVCVRSGCQTDLIHNPLGRVEGMIEQLSRRCGTDWILRFDDDEVPTTSLLQHARDVIAGAPERQYGFPLRHCVLNDRDGLSALRAHEDLAHYQWRLYNRRHVSFTTDIHSPGITVRDGTACPPDKYFVHLQWIVRSLAERRAKIDDYDRQVPNAGSSWRSYYLIEENPAAVGSAYALDRPEFSALAARLASRLPQALRVAADPLPALRR